MFIVDTNVVSELRKVKRGKASPNVAAWSRSVDATLLYVSAITIMELEIGVALMEKKDQAQGGILRKWFQDSVLPEFSERILPIDKDVALRCAKFHIAAPRSDRDALIGATAFVHGMTVVTRNVSDFSPLGVSLLNPWEFSED